MFIYTPAISGSFTIFPNKVPKEFWWWRDGAVVEHKALLISYGVRGDMDEDIHEKFVEFFSIDLDKTLVVADSGGFEIASKGKDIDVRELISWQFRNANVIISLDVPPRGSKNIDNVRDWNYCKKKSKEYLKELVRFASSRKAENKKIYGVVHGITLEEFNDWWDYVITDYWSVLDGISYAVRLWSNPLTTILCLAHAYYKGVKNVHLLGVSGTRTFIPCIYWQNMYNLLTADSSTFSIIVGRGRCLRPVDLTSVPIGKKSSRYHTAPCHCPACTYARKLGLHDRFKIDKEVKYLVTYFHNLFWLLSYLDYLNWLTDKELRDLASRESVDIDFLDCVKDRGLEWCYKNYVKDGKRLMAELSRRNVLKGKPKRWW